MAHLILPWRSTELTLVLKAQTEGTIVSIELVDAHGVDVGIGINMGIGV